MVHRVSVPHLPGTPHSPRSGGRHQSSDRPPEDHSVAAHPELYTGYPRSVARQVASPWGPLATHHTKRRYYYVHDPTTGAMTMVKVDSHGAIVQPKGPKAPPAPSGGRTPLPGAGHPTTHPVGSSTAPTGGDSRNYTAPPPRAVPAIAARRPRG
jgi:hypothetical protein